VAAAAAAVAVVAVVAWVHPRLFLFDSAENKQSVSTWFLSSWSTPVHTAILAYLTWHDSHRLRRLTRLLTARGATSPDTGHQPVRHAGRIVAIAGQITLQHPIFNYSAPHKQSERDWGDEGRNP
jgi:hypothetical protein